MMIFQRTIYLFLSRQFSTKSEQYFIASNGRVRLWSVHSDNVVDLIGRAVGFCLACAKTPSRSTTVLSCHLKGNIKKYTRLAWRYGITYLLENFWMVFPNRQPHSPALLSWRGSWQRHFCKPLTQEFVWAQHLCLVISRQMSCSQFWWGGLSEESSRWDHVFVFSQLSSPLSTAAVCGFPSIQARVMAIAGSFVQVPICSWLTLSAFLRRSTSPLRTTWNIKASIWSKATNRTW